MRVRLLWLIAVLLAACEHGTPFGSVPDTPKGPFNPISPIRLTLNPAVDLAPAWLPGGGEIVYTAERLDRADHDRCFAVLPASGGAITRYACATTTSDDSVNVFDEPAPAADGALAYVRRSTHRLPFRPVTPDVEALVLATLVDPNDVRVLRALPYTAPWGRVHQGISHVRWLSPTRLVYVAEEVTYPRPCSSCAPDTVRTGLEIATLDFAGATPVLALVPGTDSATSVAVGATGDTVYYTRANDSLVYRFTFSNARTDTIRTFRGAITQDVAVANGRLVAVVNDQLHFVTLATGAETVYTDPLARFRRPTLSPDGAHVTVERWVGRAVDIWRVDVP